MLLFTSHSSIEMRCTYYVCSHALPGWMNWKLSKIQGLNFFSAMTWWTMKSKVKEVVKREMPHLQFGHIAIRSPHIIMSRAYSTRKLSVRTTKKMGEWTLSRFFVIPLASRLLFFYRLQNKIFCVLKHDQVRNLYEFSMEILFHFSERFFIESLGKWTALE